MHFRGDSQNHKTAQAIQGVDRKTRRPRDEEQVLLVVLHRRGSDDRGPKVNVSKS